MILKCIRMIFGGASCFVCILLIWLRMNSDDLRDAKFRRIGGSGGYDPSVMIRYVSAAAFCADIALAVIDLMLFDIVRSGLDAMCAYLIYRVYGQRMVLDTVAELIQMAREYITRR